MSSRIGMGVARAKWDLLGGANYSDLGLWEAQRRIDGHLGLSRTRQHMDISRSVTLCCVSDLLDAGLVKVRATGGAGSASWGPSVGEVIDQVARAWPLGEELQIGSVAWLEATETGSALVGRFLADTNEVNARQGGYQRTKLELVLDGSFGDVGLWEVCWLVSRNCEVDMRHARPLALTCVRELIELGVLLLGSVDGDGFHPVLLSDGSLAELVRSERSSPVLGTMALRSAQSTLRLLEPILSHRAARWDS